MKYTKHVDFAINDFEEQEDEENLEEIRNSEDFKQFQKEVYAKLEEAKDCRIKLIATDGVFSMDGIVADLKSICDLADEYGALVMVDDSHSAGFMGATGRGTAEHCGVMGRVDITTGTFGKALGGASGGFTSGRKEIIDLLRQRSRPYLFSNTLAPAVAAGSINILAKQPDHWSKGMVLCITVEFYAILSLLASMLMILNI